MAKMSTALLCIFLVSLSWAATGKLVFLENFGDKVLEGDRVDFICRDSESDISKPSSASVTIDWSFVNDTGSFPITRNGSLVNKMDTSRFVFVPDLSLTLLNVRLSDSGLYRCEIKKSDSSVALTAEALLNIFHRTTHTSGKSKVYDSKKYRNTSLCSTNFSTKGYVIFDKRASAPQLTVIQENTELTLVCEYCVTVRMLTTITWLKDNKPIKSNNKTLITGNKLRIAGAKYGHDDGLYTCIVTGSKRNISAMHLMTIILEKPRKVPEILSSVWARNITPSSVTIRWRIRDQGPYVVTLINLKVRQLSSNKWQCKVKDINEELRHYSFRHLKPGSPFLLLITAVNSRGQQNTETLLFWTAPVNSTDFITSEQVLFLATDKNALGIAFGVVGFFVVLLVIYVCFSWANNHRGYKSPQPTESQRDNVQGFPIREMETLNTNTTARNNYAYYNRAFTDDFDARRI